ncbi:MAG: hypothetical protein KGY80_08420 [Candidatus Thorarchaeota archaeon]|nr:hypothetical protein [Candidatus Thorarchaeota archaeon]
MAKRRKVTLSLDEDIVAKIRNELPADKSLSGVVEESLETMSSNMFLEDLGTTLDLEAKIMSPQDIITIRRTGAKAEVLIRELRDEA